MLFLCICALMMVNTMTFAIPVDSNNTRPPDLNLRSALNTTATDLLHSWGPSVLFDWVDRTAYPNTNSTAQQLCQKIGSQLEPLTFNGIFQNIGGTAKVIAGVTPLIAEAAVKSYFTTPILFATRRRTRFSRSMSEASSSEPTLLYQDGTEVLRRADPPRNQILFVGFVTFSVFLWAAVKTNTDTDEWVEKITQSGQTDWVNNRTIMQARMQELVLTLRRWGVSVAQKTQSLPEIPRTTIREAYVNVAQKYGNASDALKLCYGICAFNGAVFLAWKIPGLAGFMNNNFVHRPMSGRSLTLLTSVFSHEGLMHFVFNAMALTSFGYAAGEYLDKQQANGPSKRLESNSAYHFLAFFVSAGLFASLASHVVRVNAYNRVVSQLSTGARTNLRPNLIGSLGASGAVYAAVTLSALAYPEAKVTLIFLPFPMPIQYGVGGLIMFDVIGLLRGWRVLDHIAHLGGGVFGIWYYFYGPRLWDYWRGASAYMFDDKPKDRRLV
ncbi:hypothetical protein DFH07DRAFT_938876 [Mycena maculata]|uniref:Peptidase S54 rhomboid domain-containing protein n=1 Tax=Mycena maculata TaxID=230809 RepID=A0AAD7JKU7_9AGAR|nr:hypothetical protein DFH07DRAFT_938876 [Mycena maculata]